MYVCSLQKMYTFKRNLSGQILPASTVGSNKYHFKVSQDHRALQEHICDCKVFSLFIRAHDKEAKVRDLISGSACNTLDLRPHTTALFLSQIASDLKDGDRVRPDILQPCEHIYRACCLGLAVRLFFIPEAFTS